jgi:hypothetical protein
VFNEVPGDQVVAVNEELVLSFVATDEDRDDLAYSFSSDVPDIQRKANMSGLSNGGGQFRWTPLAEDVGTWFFDFKVTDGDHTDVVTLQIDVRSAVGANSKPKFIRPQGSGTTLNLENDDCVEFDVEIIDSDSSTVEISEEAPKIEGANLQSTGGLSGIWRWCPTDEQVAADDRYNLVLSADDSDNPKTLHPYMVVLRKPLKPDCPGAPPVVAHTPMDESTLVGLTIAADISDDKGLKREPLLYYSTTQPADPPDLGAMTQVTMLLITGDMQSGTWAADVPNPVASMGQGSTADVYYVIVANDDDDPDGDCDHLTQSPSTASFQMTVTNPGGAGGAGVCEACTTDVQCGGANDLCVLVGTASSSFCLKECSSPSDCPTNYTCSPAALTSVDGGMARQCVPDSNDCSNPGGTTCADDAFENNDSSAEARLKPFLDPGTHNAVSCPLVGVSGDDEDWYDIFITDDTDVTVSISGGSVSDLDLALYDENLNVVDASSTFTSSESVTGCLLPGVYTIRVYAFGPEENPYTLTYSETPSLCTTMTCAAHVNEEDDTSLQARTTSIFPSAHVSTTQSICSDDDDWYEARLFSGETLIVDLTFDQTQATEDLDIHLYDDTVTDLTPCSPTDVLSCQTTNGQSGNSNEHFEFVMPSGTCTAGCDYFVVVRGWNGSENLYDISILAQP